MSSPPSVLHLRPSETTSPRVKPFPKSKIISVPFSYAPSDDGTDENLLILLHGLDILHATTGDTHVPFGKLGRQLKLPQTATLALRAPEQIPYLYEDAFQWYPSFDELGEVIAYPNPASGVNFLLKVLNHLMNECSWPPSNIHIFGFAQGGSVAIETALAFWKSEVQKQRNLSSSTDSFGTPAASPPPTAKNAFGSVVSISGPPILHHALSGPCPTAVLAFHRTEPSELVLTSDDIAALRKSFVWVREVKLGGDGMPRSRDEWRLIMEFWSQRLSKRQGDGLYEVLTGMN